MSDQIDAIGLLCPLPVLKLRKRMQALERGAHVQLITTDPAAVVDVPHYCQESGNILVAAETKGDQTWFTLEKA